MKSGPDVPRTFFVWATLVSLAIAALISGLWLLQPAASSRFEAAVQAFALLAAITGILGERWAAVQERRQLALHSIAAEVKQAAAKLTDPRFAGHAEESARATVYPRLPMSATELALNSGVLTAPQDEELVDLLSSWRDLATGFNRRLDLTELRLFTARLHLEVTAFERALHRPGGHLGSVRDHLQRLSDHLQTMYGLDVEPDLTLKTPRSSISHVHTDDHRYPSPEVSSHRS